MDTASFVIGYFACLITGVLISTHNLIIELIRHKIRSVKHSRLHMENTDKYFSELHK